MRAMVSGTREFEKKSAAGLTAVAGPFVRMRGSGPEDGMGGGRGAKGRSRLRRENEESDAVLLGSLPETDP